LRNKSEQQYLYAFYWPQLPAQKETSPLELKKLPMTLDKAVPSANFSGTANQAGVMNDFSGPSSSTTPSASSQANNPQPAAHTVNVVSLIKDTV